MMHELANQLISIVARVEGQWSVLPETDAEQPLKAGGWSRKQVIGHLIDSASNNHQRFVRLMVEPEVSLPSYKQERWVESQRYQDRSWSELLHFWAAYNRHIAHIFRSIPDAVLNHQCRLGQGEPVSLQYLAEDYVRHLKHHIESL